MGWAPAYLVRFDDICPTMAWSVWDRVEALLVEAGVRPILAVVPDNQDPELMVEEAAPNFWARVRGWQARGWSIGLHGYQHRYVSRAPGLVGLNDHSELAGLSAAEQRDKLSRGLDHFRAEGVRADLFVAPAHSFDQVTLEVLSELGLHTLSDGLFVLPHRDRHGVLWVPQQLWRFRPMPPGVWTVCHHLNRWGDAEVLRLQADLHSYRALFSDLPTIEARFHDRRSTGVAQPLAWAAGRALRWRR